jgi:hypothetical protein
MCSGLQSTAALGVKKGRLWSSFFIVGNYPGAVLVLDIFQVHTAGWLTKCGIPMKQVFFVMALLAMAAQPCLGQEPIYRCGNEYTNTKPDARSKGCKLLDGGNVTVVQGTRVSKAPTARTSPAATATAGSGTRVAASEQKARDSDARLILQSELKKAQARQEELKKEYNNGEPEKRGEEARNYQKYLDRVVELKASLARNESDMAGIRRELERLPAAAGAPVMQ